MKIYAMTNHVTGEIFEAPFKTLYRLGLRIVRESRRYHRFCWLDLHTLKEPYRPERPIAVFMQSGANGKTIYMVFSRG